jgi:NADH:ubiquinone oxidoreductase subunit D
MRLYRSETYASYWFLSLNSFLGKRGDSYDRFLIRVREMYEGINIVFQVLSNLITFSKTSNPNSKNEKKSNFELGFEVLENVIKLLRT